VTNPLLAEFANPDLLREAVGRVKNSGHRILDAFSPYPLEDLDGILEIPPSNIRYAMLIGGLAAATAALILQWYSAVIDYPINSGGRPLNSWQVFFLVPFEVGIFSAALWGVVAFLWSCHLPRLHHPLFEIPGFERATQDHFFLLTQAEDETTTRDLRHIMESVGATVTEVRVR